MIKYILKRVLLAALTLFLICFITFFAMNAIPGGPFNGEKAKSEAVMKVLNERYGLDQPVGVQFVNYMKNALHGYFGVSLKNGRSISQTIMESFAISAKIGGIAVVVALIFGLILGCVAALNRNHWPDHIIIFFVTLFTAMPSFVAASFLLLVFCLQLEWVPVTHVLYYKAAQNLHAGCPRAGLCTDGKGEGASSGEGDFCSYAEKRADSRHYLCRPPDGCHSNRFPGG